MLALDRDDHIVLHTELGEQGEDHAGIILIHEGRIRLLVEALIRALDNRRVPAEPMDQLLWSPLRRVAAEGGPVRRPQLLVPDDEVDRGSDIPARAGPVR